MDHKNSIDGYRYALVAGYIMTSGRVLYYVRGLRTKQGSEVATEAAQVMARLCALGVEPFFRVHTDNGGEFISKEFQQLLKDVCAFPTTSAPYTPKANGIIERGIQTLKDEVTRALTHAGMPVVYWHLAMQDAALRHRVRTLKGVIPKDAPKIGDAVAIRRHNPEGFRPRAEIGVFVGMCDDMPGGAWVTTQANGRLQLQKARLPRLVDIPRVTWKVVEGPSGDRLWLASNGRTSWSQEPPSGVLTLEERMLGPDDREEDLESLIKQIKMRMSKLHGDEGLARFAQYGHGFLVDSSDAGVLPAAHVIANQREPMTKGYQLDDADVETRADELARLMAEVAATQASADLMDNRVFFGDEKERWIDEAKNELRGMSMKEVLEDVDRDHLERDLGVDAQHIPRPLPTKLVVTRKPLDANAEHQDNLPWKAKVRIAACGNHELQHEVEENSTQNISPDALRLMAHQLSRHDNWIGASGDVSLAFLNSALPDNEIVLLEPPGILRRLGLVKPGTLWRVRKHIYGLRRSPRAWSQLRDATLNGKVISTGGEQIILTLVDDREGLLVVKDAKGRIRAIVAVYVDDVFAVGEPSVVGAIMGLIARTWDTKFSSFISRGEEQSLDCGDGLTLKRVDELSFIGLQIRFKGAAVAFHQRRWVLTELHKRGWLHFNGAPCLPNVDTSATNKSDESDYQENLRAAQVELGCLLWIATKRHDLTSWPRFPLLLVIFTRVRRKCYGSLRVYGDTYVVH